MSRLNSECYHSYAAPAVVVSNQPPNSTAGVKEYKSSVEARERAKSVRITKGLRQSWGKFNIGRRAICKESNAERDSRLSAAPPPLQFLWRGTAAQAVCGCAGSVCGGSSLAALSVQHHASAWPPVPCRRSPPPLTSGSGIGSGNTVVPARSTQPSPCFSKEKRRRSQRWSGSCGCCRTASRGPTC